MDLSADALTVFAVLIQAWELDITSPVTIGTIAISLCAWLLMSLDVRRSADARVHSAGERQPRAHVSIKTDN